MNQYVSTELNEIFSALSKAQGDIRVAVKDSSNPFFKSKYANLQAVIEASRPALCKNGLAVAQQIISDDGQDYLVTMLCHSSGQWLSSKMRITPAKTDVQSLGSYITYLRRYSYAALIGVYDGEEDDDGQSAIVSYNKKISPVLLENIRHLVGEDPTVRQAIYKQYNIKELADLNENDAKAVITFLEKMHQ